jgi:2,3-bisphosphoglycerate-independent phosphoglycerate mutase
MDNHPPECGGTILAEAVRELYRQGQTDYSLGPVVLVDGQDQPIGLIKDSDSVIFCCRRGDREIELTEAFVERDFAHFTRQVLHDLTFAILTLYHEKFKDLPVAFAPINICDTLGEVVSCAHLRQLRVAESEKYAHITYFLNGGRHQQFAGEEDVLVPSPKDTPFDHSPELSLAQVTSEVLRGISKHYDLIVTNFANGDVIGHVQNRQAKIQCAEIIDRRLGQVIDAAIAADYIVLVTADHGNLEEMSHPDDTDHIAHTTNPVPFILVDPRTNFPEKVQDGRLADIAPTVLHALGLTQPRSMVGASLAPEHNWGNQRRVLLIILDGWGIGREDGSNPIYLAHTPTWDNLINKFPNSQLEASGVAVGLQPGKPGNSEAGHMNIGAGRVVPQDDVRLELALQDGSFSKNTTFFRIIDDVKQRKASLHLIGLLSERSSHGCISYPLALMQMAKDKGLDKIFLHIIFDGRSTEPGSAPDLLEKLENQVKEIGVGKIVSGIGREFALDRDGNYGKIQRTYDAFVIGVGKRVHSNNGGRI